VPVELTSPGGVVDHSAGPGNGRGDPPSIRNKSPKRVYGKSSRGRPPRGFRPSVQVLIRAKRAMLGDY